MANSGHRHRIARSGRRHDYAALRRLRIADAGGFRFHRDDDANDMTFSATDRAAPRDLCQSGVAARRRTPLTCQCGCSRRMYTNSKSRFGA